MNKKIALIVLLCFFLFLAFGQTTPESNPSLEEQQTEDVQNQDEELLDNTSFDDTSNTI